MKSLIMLFLPMALLLQMCFSPCSGQLLHPIVLIPGSGGNQLEARLTRDHKPSSLICRLSARQRRGEWFRLWFDPSVLIGPLTRCFAEQMTLNYHADIDDYRNAPGVETRVPYFGSTQGLTYLDPHLKRVTNYMATLVSTLESLGYVDNGTLFGAPYDFRYGLAASGHPSLTGTTYLSDLTRLIESASASNGGRPVILLSHSLGGLFALHLLLRHPLAWRQRYIHHLITLSAPWGGTVQEMLTFASGYTLGIPLVDPLLVRAEQRSSESNLWLLPSPDIFGGKLVVTPERSYESGEMEEFLEDIGFKEGVEPYRKRVVPLVGKLEEPGVPVTCVVGSGVRTAERLRYGAAGFDEQPDVEYGDGDGTVNMVSLMRLETEWSAAQEVKVVKLPGLSHTEVLSDGGALEVIVSEITSLNSVVLSSAS